MKDFWLSVEAFFASLFYAIASIFTFGAGSGYEAYDPAKLLLKTVVISDTHADADIDGTRMENLRNGFKGINKSEEKLDALIISGDITNFGEKEEYENFKEVKAKKLFNVDTLILQMGNHDARQTNHTAPSFVRANEQYQDFCKYYKINTGGETYYTKIIKGYYYVVLGTEERHATVSERQFEWFENAMVVARQSNLPITVVFHYPVDYYCVNTEKFFKTEDSQRIFDILNNNAAKYAKPILFFSGHLHNEFSDKSYTSYKTGLYMFNLPSFQYCNNKKGGHGLVVETYDKRINIRARDFREDKWLNDYSYVINY